MDSVSEMGSGSEISRERQIIRRLLALAPRERHRIMELSYFKIAKEEHMAAWSNNTVAKLKDAGYVFQDGGKCLSPTCDKQILWFITPRGHWMPFEMDEAGIVQPHFSSCPDARKFSRKAKDQVEERKSA